MLVTDLSKEIQILRLFFNMQKLKVAWSLEKRLKQAIEKRETIIFLEV